MRVVGYHAIALVKKGAGKKLEKQDSRQEKSEVTFSEAGQKKLFSIARESISLMLQENKRLVINQSAIEPELKRKMGAFVTLKIDGKLRGCIGSFTGEDPLYEVVNRMAIASAFNDNRFNELSMEEFRKCSIEISVLGPLKRISDITEIIPGKHGIYIKKDFRSGTMLPQVATENNWTVEQFLGYTSRDKAGLGWIGWKDAEIYIYEAVVLEEKRNQ
jgi:AmmeMemoRadiSam system protein A